MKATVALVLVQVHQILGFCWKPNSTPFYGPPKVERSGDRARVEWGDVFNDGADCGDVDFMIMTHPKSKPSAYQLSDFTLKGQRSATMKVDPSVDYVFQVIAREDKGDIHGIDYKYSDMTVGYADGKTGENQGAFASRARKEKATTASTSTTVKSTTTTTSAPRTYAQPQTKSLLPPIEPLQYADYGEPNGIFSQQSETDSHAGYDPNPWYIYECVPFIKDLKGYDELSGSTNKLLEKFIKQMNQKPLELVEEFLTKSKNVEKDEKCSPKEPRLSKGYLIKCNETNGYDAMCCPNLWTKVCTEDCYMDYSSCDGGRCIPGKWVADGWPDCLDGSDENVDQSQTLPEQLVCVQCAGVILSAGFVCRESHQGLTNDCVQDTMGRNGACNNCIQYYLNLP